MNHPNQEAKAATNLILQEVFFKVNEAKTLNDAAKILNDSKSISLGPSSIGGMLHRGISNSTLLNWGHKNGNITSNGQCSYSQIEESYSETLVESINSKLKKIPQLPSQFTKTIFDRQQCAGMVQKLISIFLANFNLIILCEKFN